MTIGPSTLPNLSTALGKALPAPAPRGTSAPSKPMENKYMPTKQNASPRARSTGFLIGSRIRPTWRRSRKPASGKIALEVPTNAFTRLFSSTTSGSLASAGAISVGVAESPPRRKPSSQTAITGKRDAKVTMPKPERSGAPSSAPSSANGLCSVLATGSICCNMDCLRITSRCSSRLAEVGIRLGSSPDACEPADCVFDAAATPIPRARTMGTVTGPVVTAPQSQARPVTVGKRGGLKSLMRRNWRT
mmetsp:Transcript_11505/g.32101  ORF Transcript_11505/g.32101 Transcript_11505/m.32101 type:complete len:247 (-) Transcript_11505:751-1491(-)